MFVVSVQRIFEEHSILAADIGAVEGKPDIKIDTFKMRDGEIASAGRHAQMRITARRVVTIPLVSAIGSIFTIQLFYRFYTNFS